MNTPAEASLVAFILILVGVILRDLLKRDDGREPIDANRGHRCGCPWCGHFIQCERLDCPIKRKEN